MNGDRTISTTRIFFQCVIKALAIGLLTVVLFTTFIWMATAYVHARPAGAPAEAADLVGIHQPRQGSLLFSTSHRGLYRNAPVLNSDVSMEINAMTARVRLTQMFRNEEQDWVEGIYVFPLPENAAVDHMHMRIGERLIEGQIRERQQARRIYEKAKTSGRKAALIEQERPNMFTSSVANIGPGESILITIEYQQILDYRDQTFSIRFPMTIAPRYMPGHPLPPMEETLAEPGGHGWSINTTQVPDASRISPPVLDEGEQAVNPVTLRVNLNAGIDLDSIRSRYHEVDIRRGTTGKAVIQLKSETVNADRDFLLEWRPTASQAPRAAIFNERIQGETGVDIKYYSMLMVMPPTGELPAPLPREIVFVIDTSGSMGGNSIRQARSALLMAIRRLRPADRFNVIEFNSQTGALFALPVEASPYHVNRALQYVNDLDAGGGTEMSPALSLALSYPVNPNYMQQVVFLTDGAVGNERALFQIIQDELDDVRLFTIGIGSAPNSFFMRKAAKFGRGTFTYIGNVSEVSERMDALFSKLESPMMRNLRLHWPDDMGDVEVYPARLPDLYAGEPLIITARSGKPAGKIMITGNRGNQPWQASFPLNFRARHSGTGVLWARNRIADLLDSIHEGANKHEVRQAVIATAMRHHLVSKYTSLVAIDVTPSRPEHEALEKTAVPTNLPDGMVRSKIFGVAMAQTSTPAQLHMLVGILIIMITTGWYWFSRRCSSHRQPRRIPA
jgi:Ca-activated chloride channel family protein